MVLHRGIMTWQVLIHSTSRIIYAPLVTSSFGSPEAATGRCALLRHTAPTSIHPNSAYIPTAPTNQLPNHYTALLKMVTLYLLFLGFLKRTSGDLILLCPVLSTLLGKSADRYFQDRRCSLIGIEVLSLGRMYCLCAPRS